MIIAGVCYTTNNRDGHLFNTERTVKAVNGTDQTRRIAGGQLQIILSNSLFIIRIAMEKTSATALLSPPWKIAFTPYFS